MTTTILTYALTTKDKVKDYCGIPSTDTTTDDVITQLINQATGFIESFCGGRRFLSTTYTDELYDSMGGRSQIGGSIIFLQQMPITALTAVKYRAGTTTTPNWVTYDANGYLLYGKEGYVKFYSVLPEISLGLSFTYTAGYLIDFANETDITKHTLPFDLTQVCTQMVAEQMNIRKSRGIKTESTEGQSITYFDRSGSNMDPMTLETLRKYQTNRLHV